MLLQPNPYLQPLDLISVYLDTAKLNASPISWPGATSYMNMPSGNRYIFITVAGTQAAYIDQNYYFKPGSSYTIYNVDYFGYSAKGPALVEDDLSDPVDGYAKIRLIQGADFNHRFDWVIHDGDTLVKGIGYRDQYGDTTNFRQVKAGSYVFDLFDYDAPYTYEASLQATLEPGRIYTILSLLRPTADSVLASIGMKLFTNK